MATKIKFSTKQTQRMIEFTEKAPQGLVGKRIPILENPHLIRWDDRFDLGTRTLYKASEKIGSAFPSFNELFIKGIVKEFHPYKEVMLTDVEETSKYYNNGKLNTKAVQTYFKEQGINVSLSQIDYCFKAWSNGLKVGYRGRSSHLFTPSGMCNPLSFTATTLHPICRDWQKTYIC